MPSRAIIHLDLDAFFVAVERLDDPALIGRPVIVGGRAEARGVVASASYEARVYGIHSAMPTAQALRLCPGVVRVEGHHGRYAEMSRRVMALLGEYTPLLEPISIDEAFLDVTGTEAHYGPPGQLAQTLQDRIEAELGLSASLGVASNKLVAKIASDLRKPHGIMVVPSGEEAAFLAPLPVRRLWGVGEVTGRELGKLGIETIGDLARLPLGDLRGRFGAHGEGLWRAARGLDDSPVTPEREAKSLSREETFAQDIGDPAILRRELLRLSDAVAARLRRHGCQARTVGLKLRYGDFTTLTRQATLSEPTDAGPVIYAQAIALFEAAWNRQPVRLLGIGAANLIQAGRQLRLFTADGPDGAANAERQAQLDAALDRIRARFGDRAVQRAALLEEPEELWVGRSVEE
ncbi:MAG: DNA polymerase IV [Chloroflexi bacterium]|nr:DNA polymerase IV [Chloroflexota bacterium]